MLELVAGVYLMCAQLLPRAAPAFLVKASVSDPLPADHGVTADECRALYPQVHAEATRIM
jgi:hypothetical protein